MKTISESILDKVIEDCTLKTRKRIRKEIAPELAEVKRKLELQLELERDEFCKANQLRKSLNEKTIKLRKRRDRIRNSVSFLLSFISDYERVKNRKVLNVISDAKGNYYKGCKSLGY
ncbi:MAG: hypothetical protein SVK08_01000 [Halobacteriota archaeon]|nr:hypothetical protein [Halobacteriota archaeon]